MNNRNNLLIAMIALAGFFPHPAQAGDSTKFKTRLTFTTQYNAMDHADLGTKDEDTRDSYSAQLRAQMNMDFGDSNSGYLDLRGVTADGDSGIQDENGQINPSGTYLEARQYWLKLGRFMGGAHTSLVTGRQRIREESGLWWNRDIESMRLLYNTKQLRGFFGFGEVLTSNKTAKDSFRAEDRGRFRMFGEGSWQWKKDHFLEARFQYQSDHSGTGEAGDIIPEEKRDDEDMQATWAGVRAAGTNSFASGLLEKFKYKADLMGVSGKVDNVTTVAGPNSRTRAIAGVDRLDMRGWAFDTQFNFALKAPLRPTVTLGYAYGSGDGNGGNTDNAFRQTGLQSNASRLGLASGAVYNYGEVLRPELSNLHILTAGVGVPLKDYGDLSFFYHYYELADTATELRRAGINAALNGASRHLGQEGDVVFNLDLGKMMSIERAMKLRASAGVFDAGAAYGPADDETSVRLFTELVLGLN